MTEKQMVCDNITNNITSQTIDNLKTLYNKHKTISGLKEVDHLKSLKESQAEILKHSSLKFAEIWSQVGCIEEFHLTEIYNVHAKFVEYIFKNSQLSLMNSYIEINGEIFADGETHTFCNFQDELIEFLALCSFRGSISRVSEKTLNKMPNKVIFNVEEAEEFTGYKKSYLYKAKHEGLIRAGQSKKGGKLHFKRQDLINFMFREESVTVEDLL